MMSALRLSQIGPSAITQVTGALEHELGRDPARHLLRSTGLVGYLDAPPQDMVDELEVISLHSAVRDHLPGRVFRKVELAAGYNTADYLLAHRIPKWAQRLMRVTPAWLSKRLLSSGIARHARTFAGSGRCTARAGRSVVITVEGCAICCGAHAREPQCHFYAGIFERLFAALVDGRAKAVETECIATGAHACRFSIDWPTAGRRLLRERSEP